MKIIILLNILILSCCSESSLSRIEKISMKDDMIGFTMNSMPNTDISYGKIGKFFYVTKNINTNDYIQGNDLSREYLLYEKNEILKHHPMFCVDPDKNIDLITHYYDFYKSDTTQISAFKFFKDSIRIKLDRQLDKLSYIGWKLIIYKKNSKNKWIISRESLLTANHIFER